MKRKRFLPIWAKAGLPVMVALFFTSCGWECQGIPEELPWFVPYDYAGKTVSFTNGEDTVEVSYDYPSKKMWTYRNYSMSRGRCETRIVQKGCWGGYQELEAMRDSMEAEEYYYSPLSFSMTQTCYKENICTYYIFSYRLPDTTMRPLPEDIRSSAMIDVDISMDFLQAGESVGHQGCYCYYLPEWTSEGGNTYHQVLKHVIPKTRHGHFDTIYFADRKGMVQMVSEEQGETWYLIPPEDEAGAE